MNDEIKAAVKVLSPGENDYLIAQVEQGPTDVDGLAEDLMEMFPDQRVLVIDPRAEIDIEPTQVELTEFIDRLGGGWSASELAEELRRAYILVRRPESS